MGVHRLGAELEFLCRDHGVGLPPGLDLAKTAAAGFLGGRGKTSAAIAVANELAFYYGRKVLYLSLEEWPLTELFFLRDPGVRSFGDYLYYLFSDGRREWAASLEPFLLRNVFGVETFAFGFGPNALRSLAFEDLTVLLRDLWGRSRCDWVLLDFGESVTGNFPVLADLCRSLFCLTDGTLPDRVRTDRIRNFLLQSGGEPLADKLVPVRNFWTPEQLLEPDEIPIGNDPDSFFIQDGYWCIDPSRGFGMGVRTIAEILEGVGENPGKEVDPVRPVGHQFAGNRGLR
ncbi:MAG: hypothetical protein IJO79_01615 [Firmicutes bacterium]|nr:hypothetical protein [Bacillota bacterium]